VDDGHRLHAGDPAEDDAERRDAVVHHRGPGDLRQGIVPVEQAVPVGVGVQRVGDEPLLGQVGEAVGVAVALEIRVTRTGGRKSADP